MLTVNSSPLRVVLFLLFLLNSAVVFCQFGNEIKWDPQGSSYTALSEGNLVRVSLPENKPALLVSKDKLVPVGRTEPLRVSEYTFSTDQQQILLFTNTQKVWRYHTRGDYWLYDLKTGNLVQMGKSLPVSSLMFAKFSPDGTRVAYVSEHNLYVEELPSHQIKKLTEDGTVKIINGTFDWVYEEEFDCRDGFRWSPDSKHIAYWQIDGRQIKDYLMLNTTDSIYPRAIAVEYPVAGELPSPYKVGVVNISSAKTTWMDIPTDPQWGSYVPRMEWAANSHEIIIQHLNRKQNQSDLMICETSTGKSTTVYSETDAAWIDILPSWNDDYKMGGWDWLEGGKAFLWASEKDGWRHLYKVSRDGKKETLVTVGNFDVMKIVRVDDQGHFVYFIASPKNATQAYLYRSSLDGKGSPELLSPASEQGTHEYYIAPRAKYALHVFSNYYTPQQEEWVSLPDHKSLEAGNPLETALAKFDKASSLTSFFTIKTPSGIEMDAWMTKPAHFDSTKKYPVVFYVYTEPAGQNVKDEYGAGRNFLYRGNMSEDGYIYISIDNRGTPVPKGREWRKSIYRKIGQLNIDDQAMAAREILKWPFVDSSRIAVWGWSGGGSATLNLMFQHPEIYKTGIAIAAVGYQLTYDNVYQERYMGLPQENKEDFLKGSPVTYAKNLQGNLLYIHGTGDDNVHYSNAERLINELVKYNKLFQLMSYPNRTHSISEGVGTQAHLSHLYTDYLKTHCPPGGR